MLNISYPNCQQHKVKVRGVKEQAEGGPLCAGGPPRSTAVLVRNQGEQRSEDDILKKLTKLQNFHINQKVYI